jgi:LysR family transcriptional regulator, hydrogen peroxide-inducible genes activator
MNLQDFRYIAAVSLLRHFGRAAEACHVSQPTLSSQIRKLEEELGVALFERTNKRVELTAAGERIVKHANRVLEEAGQIEAIAKAERDPMRGPLRLGAIPTLAPYLMPLILQSLQTECPGLTVELWEDGTHRLVEMVRDHRLDAALLATIVEGPELTELSLFDEPLIAALPPDHPLTSRRTLAESELAGDVLVLADGHCLSNQALQACGRRQRRQGAWQAASLETLVNLVAAGYGTTLIPALAAPSLSTRDIVLRPLEGRTVRTIRLASRPTFPRPQALRALERVIRNAVKSHLRAGPGTPRPQRNRPGAPIRENRPEEIGVRVAFSKLPTER